MSATERILADHVTIDHDDPEQEVYWAALTIVMEGKRPTVIRRMRWHGRVDPAWEFWKNAAYLSMVFDEAALNARLEEYGWEIDVDEA